MGAKQEDLSLFEKAIATTPPCRGEERSSGNSSPGSGTLGSSLSGFSLGEAIVHTATQDMEAWSQLQAGGDAGRVAVLRTGAGREQPASEWPTLEEGMISVTEASLVTETQARPTALIELQDSRLTPALPLLASCPTVDRDRERGVLSETGYECTPLSFLSLRAAPDLSATLCKGYSQAFQSGDSVYTAVSELSCDFVRGRLRERSLGVSTALTGEASLCSLSQHSFPLASPASNLSTSSSPTSAPIPFRSSSSASTPIPPPISEGGDETSFVELLGCSDRRVASEAGVPQRGPLAESGPSAQPGTSAQFPAQPELRAELGSALGNVLQAASDWQELGASSHDQSPGASPLFVPNAYTSRGGITGEMRGGGERLGHSWLPATLPGPLCQSTPSTFLPITRTGMLNQTVEHLAKGAVVSPEPSPQLSLSPDQAEPGRQGSSLGYTERVGVCAGQWGMGRPSFDSLVLRGLRGESPRRRAYSAIAHSLNHILSQGGGEPVAEHWHRRSGGGSLGAAPSPPARAPQLNISGNAGGGASNSPGSRFDFSACPSGLGVPDPSSSLSVFAVSDPGTSLPGLSLSVPEPGTSFLALGVPDPGTSLLGLSVPDPGTSLLGLSVPDPGTSLLGLSVPDPGTSLLGLSVPDPGTSLLGLGLPESGTSLPGLGVLDPGTSLAWRSRSQSLPEHVTGRQHRGEDTPLPSTEPGVTSLDTSRADEPTVSSTTGRASAQSLTSLEVDNYSPHWGDPAPLLTPPLPTTDIEQRIPFYLWNLGIHQSPTSILTTEIPPPPVLSDPWGLGISKDLDTVTKKLLGSEGIAEVMWAERSREPLSVLSDEDRRKIDEIKAELLRMSRNITGSKGRWLTCDPEPGSLSDVCSPDSVLTACRLPAPTLKPAPPAGAGPNPPPEPQTPIVSITFSSRKRLTPSIPHEGAPAQPLTQGTDSEFVAGNTTGNGIRVGTMTGTRLGSGVGTVTGTRASTVTDTQAGSGVGKTTGTGNRVGTVAGTRLRSEVGPVTGTWAGSGVGNTTATGTRVGSVTGTQLGSEVSPKPGTRLGSEFGPVTGTRAGSGVGTVTGPGCRGFPVAPVFVPFSVADPGRDEREQTPMAVPKATANGASSSPSAHPARSHVQLTISPRRLAPLSQTMLPPGKLQLTREDGGAPPRALSPPGAAASLAHGPPYPPLPMPTPGFYPALPVELHLPLGGPGTQQPTEVGARVHAATQTGLTVPAKSSCDPAQRRSSRASTAHSPGAHTRSRGG
eukprot:gi/632979993/ref/XP_007906779.1/ PREDICTED: mucin-19-like [Callorhinchus milii]